MAGKDWRTFGEWHKKLFRWTGGRFVNRMGHGRKALLLTTTGRKSGAQRTTPLIYMDYNAQWVVYPSNGGKEAKPAWWLNLEANADATIEIRRDPIHVTARRATDEEYQRIWPIARDYNSHWKMYEQDTKRHIPLVILARR